MPGRVESTLVTDAAKRHVRSFAADAPRPSAGFIVEGKERDYVARIHRAHLRTGTTMAAYVPEDIGSPVLNAVKDGQRVDLLILWVSSRRGLVDIWACVPHSVLEAENGTQR